MQQGSHSLVTMGVADSLESILYQTFCNQWRFDRCQSVTECQGDLILQNPENLKQGSSILMEGVRQTAMLIVNNVLCLLYIQYGRSPS